jgi:hypothetical protein
MKIYGTLQSLHVKLKGNIFSNVKGTVIFYIIIIIIIIIIKINNKFKYFNKLFFSFYWILKLL